MAVLGSAFTVFLGGGEVRLKKAIGCVLHQSAIHIGRGKKQYPNWVVYFSIAAGGGKYGALNYPFVYRIFSWCAKGIVIFHNSHLTILLWTADGKKWLFWAVLSPSFWGAVRFV